MPYTDQKRQKSGRMLGVSIAAMIAASGSTVVLAERAEPITNDEGRVILPNEQPPIQEGEPNPETPTTETTDLPPLPPADATEIELSDFSEPMQLSAFVEYVVGALRINAVTKGELTGTVTINAPVKVKRERLLDLLDALLEQHNFTITYDPSGFYTIRPTGEVPLNIGGEAPTTRVFSTPNVRPSALKGPIEAQLAPAGTQAGQPVQGIRTFSYVDELGVIVATDTPRRLMAVEALITRLLEQHGKSQFTRIELKYLAAPTARDRALDLVGQGSGATRGSANPNNPGGDPNQGQPVIPGQQTSRSTDNLADRLTVDPQGNALIFRGVPDEVALVKSIIEVIDVPNELRPTKYEVGGAAKQVADIARGRGLGEVTVIAAPSNTDELNPFFYNGQDNQGNQQQQQTATGGPMMVVDEERGQIIYYATPQQHDQLAALVDELDPQSDSIIVREYKLRHNDADRVAALIMGVLTNQQPTESASSPLLPDGSTGTGASTFSVQRGRNGRTVVATGNSIGGQDELSFGRTDDIFVVADRSNNQVLVKAPVREQPNLARLIGVLDQRRPQVFVEVKVVVINATDEMRLAFETQLINANGSGGVLNTNFGLSSFPTDASLNTPKNVATDLAGLTAAVIKSDMVPIIITALARDGDARILSSPSLLVDDNVEGTIESVDQQPTTTTNLGGGTDGGTRDSVSFAGYEDAGTKLVITPQISEGGYLRLKYEIELSNFTGVGVDGIPPPKQTNTITAESVTVPTDSTVVVGGVTLDAQTKTVVKVPGLGDIPLIGALFSDQNWADRKTILYVFITPKIMRDPTFADLRLLTSGPQRSVELADDTPPLEPARFDLLGSPKSSIPPELLRPASEPPADPPSGTSSGTSSGTPTKSGY